MHNNIPMIQVQNNAQGSIICANLSYHISHMDTQRILKGTVSVRPLPNKKEQTQPSQTMEETINNCPGYQITPGPQSMFNR